MSKGVLIMSYAKQHEIGLAGLALLRNWLIGDEVAMGSILDEIRILTSSPTVAKKVMAYNVTKGYKAWADTYDSAPNLLTEVEQPAVRTMLQKFSPGRALDAACGTGRYSELLHSLGHAVTGFDLSPEMLSQARKIRNKQIKFVQGDLTTIPLENSVVDLAICALALTHLPNIDKALSELSRVTRPGGYVVISDIHPWLVALGGQADFYDKHKKHGYIKNYVHWHSSYIQSFNKNNLKIIQCVEPTLGHEHLKTAQRGFDLSATTVATALQGLPIALVWVLERR